MQFFDETVDTYDSVSFWATFGRDLYWKELILDKIPNAGFILDLACGTGILTRKIATRFPQSKVVGVDLSNSYLQLATKNSYSFQNISYIQQDAEHLHLEQKFDCICSSYLPKYCDPKRLVERCVDHLNPGGVLILHDFILPQNRIVKKLWNWYFVLLAGVGLFLPKWRYPFLELPKLIKTSNWLDSYKRELEKENFRVILQTLTWNTSAILVAYS